MAYEGSVTLISGIKQANNQNFPLVDAPAVRVTDEKRLSDVLDYVDEQIEIDTTDSESPYHYARNIYSLQVNGNEEAFGTIHLANEKNIMPESPEKIVSANGLDVTFHGRFVTMVGAASASSTYRNKFLDCDVIAPGNYLIVAHINGTYTGAEDSYFQLYGRTTEDQDILLKSMYYNGYTEKTWSLTTTATIKQLYMTFVSRTISVTGTLRFWFGIFPSSVVIADTQTSILSDESETIAIDASNYPHGIDSMQHRSIASYKPTVQQYVDSQDISSRLVYATPEAFGAKGDDDADDTDAIAECIAYAIKTGVPVKGYKKYKTTQPIDILGNNLDIYFRYIRYTGTDYALGYQGLYSQLTISQLISSGNGLYLYGQTGNMHYNTFIVGSIDAAKNGIYIYANKNIYSNYVKFDYIAGGTDYSCIRVEKDPNTQTGYSSEWHFIGGRVDRALWGIRGLLSDADEISIYSESLGSDGHGGAIWDDNGTIPRINYVRTGEIQNHNTVLKVSGEFVRKQSPGGTGVFGTNLTAIDITELTLPAAAELLSENTQIPTNIIVHRSDGGWYNLTKNLILWGNRFQFPQFKYITKELNDDLDMTDQYYEGFIPQKFIVSTADVRVDLHPTYATNCLGQFKVEQKNGYKIDVYDYCGHLIFDGSEYSDGEYTLTAYLKDPSTGYKLLYYDMSNQLWEIEKTPDVSTPADFQAMLDDYFSGGGD